MTLSALQANHSIYVRALYNARHTRTSVLGFIAHILSAGSVRTHETAGASPERVCWVEHRAGEKVSATRMVEARRPLAPSSIGPLSQQAPGTISIAFDATCIATSHSCSSSSHCGRGLAAKVLTLVFASSAFATLLFAAQVWPCDILGRALLESQTPQAPPPPPLQPSWSAFCSQIFSTLSFGYVLVVALLASLICCVCCSCVVGPDRLADAVTNALGLERSNTAHLWERHFDADADADGQGSDSAAATAGGQQFGRHHGIFTVLKNHGSCSTGEEEERQCTVCGLILPESMFHKDRGRRRPECKRCFNEGSGWHNKRRLVRDFEDELRSEHRAEMPGRG